MGVSGSGKSTIGAALSQQLGWPYADADEFHPPANVAKMSAGHPLNDDDRRPWLEAIAAYIDSVRGKGEHAIVSCSALKRAYRDVIVGERADVRLVLLDGTKEEIFARMSARKEHFMPPTLLDSQFATLERPVAPTNGRSSSRSRSRRRRLRYRLRQRLALELECHPRERKAGDCRPSGYPDRLPRRRRAMTGLLTPAAPSPPAAPNS